MTPPHRATRRRPVTALMVAVLAAVTTYLLLDRNHAEELGGGTRAVADLIVGRQAALTMLLAVAVVALAAALTPGRPAPVARRRR